VKLSLVPITNSLGMGLDASAAQLAADPKNQRDKRPRGNPMLTYAQTLFGGWVDGLGGLREAMRRAGGVDV